MVNRTQQSLAELHCFVGPLTPAVGLFKRLAQHVFKSDYELTPEDREVFKLSEENGSSPSEDFVHLVFDELGPLQIFKKN